MSSSVQKVSFTMETDQVREIRAIDKDSPSIAQSIRRALKIFKYLMKMKTEGFEIYLERPKGSAQGEPERTKLVIE